MANPEWPTPLTAWLCRSLEQTQNNPELNERMQRALREAVQAAVDRNVVWTTNWAGKDPYPVDLLLTPPPPPPPPQPQTYQPPPSNRSAPPFRPANLPPPPRAAAPATQRGRSLQRNASDAVSTMEDVVPLGSTPPPRAVAKKPGKKAAASPTTVKPDLVRDDRQLRARRERFSADSASYVGITPAERTLLEAERVAAKMREADLAGTEVDLDALVVVGTSEQLEKSYLRLTSAPDPATVRPERVLTKALQHVKRRLQEHKSEAYVWASEQLKSIRQDLQVQHIKNRLTMDVYETHARAAMWHGGPDFREFNHCCTQLLDLFAGAGAGHESTNHNAEQKHKQKEFRAYMILYHVYARLVFNFATSAATLASWRVVRSEGINEEEDEERVALDVWRAVELGDWVSFFALRARGFAHRAQMGAVFLGNPVAEHVRGRALTSICAAGGKVSVSSAFIRRTLAFDTEPDPEAAWNSFATKYVVPVDPITPTLVDVRATIAKIREM